MRILLKFYISCVYKAALVLVKSIFVFKVLDNGRNS